MVHKPVQVRSHDTLERLLDAAEQLLNSTSWNDLTVQQVVSSARSSVGSFYARFEGKEDLLRELSARLSNAAESESARIAQLDTGMTTEAYTKLVVRRLTRFHLRHRGLIRTLTLVPKQTGERLTADGLRTAAVFDVIVRSLIARRASEKHVRLGLFAVAMAIREQVCFGDNAAPLTRSSDRALADELAHMFAIYLVDTGQ